MALRSPSSSRNRLAAAVAISLLLHGALLVLSRGQALRLPQPASAPQAGRIGSTNVRVALQPPEAEQDRDESGAPRSVQPTQTGPQDQGELGAAVTGTEARSRQPDPAVPAEPSSPAQTPATPQTQSEANLGAASVSSRAAALAAPAPPVARASVTPRPHARADSTATPETDNGERGAAASGATTGALPPGPAEAPQGSTSTPADGVVPFEKLTAGARLIEPEYPAVARRWGHEGVATVRIVINPDGTVESAELLESSGHSSLDRAALRVVQRRWRFPPQDTTVITLREFAFELRR